MVAVNTLAPPALPPRRLVLWTELTSVFSSWNTQLASQNCLFYLKVGVLESIVDSELQVTHLQLLETWAAQRAGNLFSLKRNSVPPEICNSTIMAIKPSSLHPCESCGARGAEVWQDLTFITPTTSALKRQGLGGPQTKAINQYVYMHSLSELCSQLGILSEFLLVPVYTQRRKSDKWWKDLLF